MLKEEAAVSLKSPRGSKRSMRHAKTNRDRLDIYYEMLQNLRDGLDRRTNLMFASNISYDQMKRYEGELLHFKLITMTPRVVQEYREGLDRRLRRTVIAPAKFCVTQKGIKFCDEMDKLKGILGEKRGAAL